MAYDVDTQLEIYKCPFCKNDNPRVVLDYIDEVHYSVECRVCLALGPVSDSKAEAVEEWNRAWKK
jgi:Lar family restriction alleviation protein